MESVIIYGKYVICFAIFLVSYRLIAKIYMENAVQRGVFLISVIVFYAIMMMTSGSGSVFVYSINKKYWILYTSVIPLIIAIICNIIAYFLSCLQFNNRVFLAIAVIILCIIIYERLKEDGWTGAYSEFRVVMENGSGVLLGMVSVLLLGYWWIEDDRIHISEQLKILILISLVELILTIIPVCGKYTQEMPKFFSSASLFSAMYSIVWDNDEEKISNRLILIIFGIIMVASVYTVPWLFKF